MNISFLMFKPVTILKINFILILFHLKWLLNGLTNSIKERNYFIQ